ncbi:sensor histidine kinase [Spirosoma pollinicola]|uniref:histidine kinase n=1 Tax=Spirosoma pollinicola TaxID=2057025 RepID=A0A2K8Z7D9_9BACT|nr:ATP-binding protein [Spirosoma pollinicola]AUD05754.1 PAS domain-containing sensor histidine kinase [Spirosoma pollinicola]
MTGIETSFDNEAALEIEQLRLALQAAQVGTWDYNLETNQAQWSDICKKLFGLPADMHITSATLLAKVHPDDQERVAQANARILSPHSDGDHNVIFRTQREDETYRWVQAKGRTILNEEGQILRFNGIVFDITELKQAQEALRQSAEVLEQRVTERTQALKEANQKLKKSNENLAEFAYIASHDLQEPLRKIQSFGDILKDQYTIELGDGITYLERMQVAARRMSTLIKDLLTFSRLSIRKEAMSWVSLTDIVTDVLLDLELSIQETGAEVELGPLPKVQGDVSQLTQLFQNLLSNAIKFGRIGIPPVIIVRADVVEAGNLPTLVQPVREADKYCRIDVADNGIGFDEKYVDRIFQVFQRLHGVSQYAGTGIGLAICEKVVTNHGGVIAASSQLGQGTTFSVYLPL